MKKFLISAAPVMIAAAAAEIRIFFMVSPPLLVCPCVSRFHGSKLTNFSSEEIRRADMNASRTGSSKSVYFDLPIFAHRSTCD